MDYGLWNEIADELHVAAMGRGMTGLTHYTGVVPMLRPLKRRTDFGAHAAQPDLSVACPFKNW